VGAGQFERILVPALILAAQNLNPPSGGFAPGCFLAGALDESDGVDPAAPLAGGPTFAGGVAVGAFGDAAGLGSGDVDATGGW
jgi:hypothetical protein